jgi:hypothetical protein
VRWAVGRELNVAAKPTPDCIEAAAKLHRVQLRVWVCAE